MTGVQTCALPISFQYGVQYLLKIDKINSQRKYINPIVLNHIDFLKHITSKTGLIRSLSSYYASIPEAIEHKYSIFDSMATSFIIDIENMNDEYILFVQRYKEISQKLFTKERMPAKHCEQNIW